MEEYSRLQLTFASDRTIAIAGLAKVFAQRLQDRYVAGLWESHLFFGLSWEVNHSGKRYRPAPYRGPSWSWCSVEGAVQFPWFAVGVAEGSPTSLGSVTAIHLELADSDNPCGELLGSNIELEARLQPAVPLEHGELSLFDPDTATKVALPPSLTLHAAFPEGPTPFWGLDEQDSEGKFVFQAHHDVGQLLSSGDDGVSYMDLDNLEYIGPFCLPLVKYTQRGELCLTGLLLTRKPSEPDVFRRVGHFWTAGAEAIDLCCAGEMKKFRIV